MNRSALIRVVLPSFAILLSSCMTLSTSQLDVPFHPQPGPSLCGMNCLAMAFEFFGIPYDIGELESQAFVPALNGSPPELLADVAETYGLQAGIENLPPAAIKTAIESGWLPIVFIPPANGETIGHFILITGAAENPRHIRAHDGQRRHRRLRLSDNPYVSLLLKIPGKEPR